MTAASFASPIPIPSGWARATRRRSPPAARPARARGPRLAGSVSVAMSRATAAEAEVSPFGMTRDRKSVIEAATKVASSARTRAVSHGDDTSSLSLRSRLFSPQNYVCARTSELDLVASAPVYIPSNRETEPQHGRADRSSPAPRTGGVATGPGRHHRLSRNRPGRPERGLAHRPAQRAEALGRRGSWERPRTVDGDEADRRSDPRALSRRQSASLRSFADRLRRSRRQEPTGALVPPAAPSRPHGDRLVGSAAPWATGRAARRRRAFGGGRGELRARAALGVGAGGMPGAG